MTSIVNQVTSHMAATSPYDSTTVILCATAVLVLLGLQILKELVRASSHPQLELWSEVLNIAIVPLTIAFCYVVIVRFIVLVPI